MTPEPFQAPSLEELAPLFPNYRMEAFIAQGGMGAVYLATQTSLDRQVAIKILPRELGVDEEFRESFAAEAKAMAKLNHPNLIGVYDFGEVDGMPFIIMEYVAGKPLHDSAYGKQIDPHEAARITMETLHGLQHAHEHGILHRDVKPANILLEPLQAAAKLGDFGLAMASGEAGEGASIFGTPGYAAPEVYEGNPDARSDVYAAAIIFYQLLTGQLPGDPYQHPSALAPCDKRFDALLAKALQPNPDDRHQSASELAEAIDACAKKPVVAAPVVSGPLLTPRPVPLASQRKSSAGPVIGALVALVVVGGIAFALLSGGSKEEPLEDTADTPAQSPAQAQVESGAAPDSKEDWDFPTEESKPVPATNRFREQLEAQNEALANMPDPVPVEEESKENGARPKPKISIKTKNKRQEEEEKKLLVKTPVKTYDHHAFLKRGRDYCIENTEKILSEYQEDLVKNIESLEREGRSILRDEEYLDRKSESIRKDNMELVTKKFIEEGRLPKTLTSETPEAFDALTWREGVVERALREALDKQNNLDLALDENLKPVATKYVAGLRKEADRLEAEGQASDAKILRSEAREVENTPNYFVSIARGENPLPPGLEADPALMALKSRVLGHWYAPSNNAELVILSNGDTFLPMPVQVGTWIVEDGQAFLVWEARKDPISLPDDDASTFSTYNHRARTVTRYHKLEQATSSQQDPIVGSWLRRANDAVYHFTPNGTFKVIKWNAFGTYTAIEGGYKLKSGGNRFEFTLLEDGRLSGLNLTRGDTTPFYLRKIE